MLLADQLRAVILAAPSWQARMFFRYFNCILTPFKAVIFLLTLNIGSNVGVYAHFRIRKKAFSSNQHLEAFLFDHLKRAFQSLLRAPVKL
jgi:hypothetical protein